MNKQVHELRAEEAAMYQPANTGERLYLSITEDAYRGAVKSVRLTVPGHFIKDEKLKVNIHLSLAPHHDQPFSALTWNAARKAKLGKYDSLVDTAGNMWLRGKAGKQFVKDCETQLKKGRVLFVRLVVAKGAGEELAEFFLDPDCHTLSALGSWEGGWVR